MLSIPPGIKVYISTKPLDMRKSLDGMAYVVSQQLKKDVFSGHIFVFCNKRGDKVKTFYWDRNGYCSWYKRLERGIFKIPKLQGNVFQVTPAELGLILEGIDLTYKQRLRAL